MPANRNARRKWGARVLAPHEVAKYAADIRQLTRNEQERQAGELLKGVGLDDFLDKILARADFAVLNVEGKCCGFCAFYTYEPALDTAFITLFLVTPNVRRSGMARSVLEVVAGAALQYGFRYLTLKVRQDNTPAIHFYLSQGFQIAERHGGDIVMSLEMTALDGPNGNDADKRGSRFFSMNKQKTELCV
ncbi:GNAT family N-acetyltransferase [Billgrantia pellis]|uniref:GNAT family N-acetyltransferase n=1 Tax=Billgrantia pellis TaxID=2606936 RepID=A0A7V7G1N1_9GAMM|nr:GNAT family N-acetyltransferase [Halomonas pellis]KAA0012853.1 GNAT family N-acetyltransferase [Halomonas pellis]